ncbi:BolA/IbaG family iron-sulfur metabolism protein [Glaciecola sp. XM2]|jgi:BolA protein|uniref:BolA family protein n=1 Tax=Glaciecola sp. XM2 TaxID=1914931 RepID=UPI001BDE69D2|nr:BolA/IbaG family iron-sulfur metabolism protein [Glaciecola sp. XM2]MBT1450344.1 BolA/IbaG family iron-sulfur metabolism protein [Glaciecola sp. XM2]
MLVQKAIETKLQDLSPSYLLVENESHMHSVPENSETHFKVTLVTEQFDGLRLLQRHRKINQLLADELAGPVHALALHTYTQDEWVNKHGAVPDSPNCLGGSKQP